MPSITPMMSEMRLLCAAISPIVRTTSPTTWPPCAAERLASPASDEASRAEPLFCETAAVISSIDAAVCCSELACSSVRCDRSWLPAAIWRDAPAIWSTPERTSPTMARSAVVIDASAAIRLVASSPRSGISRDRSPEATVRAISTAASGSPPSVRSRLRVTTVASTTATPSATASSAAIVPSRTLPRCSLSS